MLEAVLGPRVDEKILEESVDMLKYLLGLFIINGFTVDDVYSMFIKNSEIVENRFKKELSIDNK